MSAQTKTGRCNRANRPPGRFPLRTQTGFTKPATRVCNHVTILTTNMDKRQPAQHLATLTAQWLSNHNRTMAEPWKHFFHDSACCSPIYEASTVLLGDGHHLSLIKAHMRNPGLGLYTLPASKCVEIFLVFLHTHVLHVSLFMNTMSPCKINPSCV